MYSNYVNTILSLLLKKYIISHHWILIILMITQMREIKLVFLKGKLVDLTKSPVDYKNK